MILWLIPLLLVLASVFVIGMIVARHAGELRALNVDTDPERARRTQKRQLFAQRVERLGGERAKKVGRAATKAGRGFQAMMKRVYTKAQAMERRLQHQAATASGTTGSLEMRQHLREEAEALIEREAYTAAEQRLIELLSYDQKNAEIYELLGNVYVKTKQYDQARQTFEYAHVLKPEDASILTSLGELALRRGEVEAAIEVFHQAVELRPNNPKYLDFLIESSLMGGKKAMAIKGLKLLREVNPENKKIEEFEARIREIGS